jgi:hypothetical protein
MRVAREYLSLSYCIIIFHIITRCDYGSGGWGFKSLRAHQHRRFTAFHGDSCEVARATEE